MSYELIKNHTTINRTIAHDRIIRYVVLHYTGNETDTAKANCHYFKATYRGASAHYFVDASTVYECVAVKNIAWAVGKNYGKNNLFGVCTNANSVSVEMCGTNGAVSVETMENAVALTKALMKQYNVPPERVVRHFDVCGKQCPGWAGWGTKSGDSGALWTQFQRALVQEEPCAPKLVLVTADRLHVRAGAGTTYKITAVVRKNEVFTIVQTLGNWGKLKSGMGWICLDYTQDYQK